MSIRISARLNPPGVAGEVLAPSDLTYLGMFKLPDSPSGVAQDMFAYAQAFLSGRRVSGTTTLFISGSQFGSGLLEGVYEVAIPADVSLTKVFATAPTTSVIRGWTTNNGMFVNAVDDDGARCVVSGIGYVGDLYGNGTQLIVTCARTYGSTPFEFPNVSTCVIANDSTVTNYGPWGTGDWENTCGNIIQVPQAIQDETGCAELASIPQPRGGEAGAPWGAELRPFSLPPVSTPPDPHHLTAPYTISPYQTAIRHSSAQPQARNTNFRVCGSNLPNMGFVEAIGGCIGGQFLEGTPDPVFGGHYDPIAVQGITIDWVHGGVWIHGPSKQGIIFSGQLAETISIANGFTQDVVYGGWRYDVDGTTPVHTSAYHIDTTNCHQRYGPSICCHGHYSPTDEAVGPCADTIVSYLWFYAEQDIIDILAGRLAPYGAIPAYTQRLVDYSEDAFFEAATHNYQTAGMWFDPDTNRLYVAEANQYFSHFGTRPLIHVFSVNC